MGETSTDVRPLPLVPLAMTAVAVLVGGACLGWVLFGATGGGTDTTADSANSASAPPDSSTTTAPDADTGADGNPSQTLTPASREPASDGATSSDTGSGTGSGTDGGGDTFGGDPAADTVGGDEPTVPTIAANAPSGGDRSTSGDTVEADENPTADEVESADDSDDDEIGATTTTALDSAGARCPIVLSIVEGQAGVVEHSGDGICDGIQLTLRSVVSHIDVGTVDWANDLRVCEKHPSAADIGFSVMSASGSVVADDSFFRGDVPDGQDLVASFTVDFRGGYLPGIGVQPIAVCRTPTAELVVVHRAGS